VLPCADDDEAMASSQCGGGDGIGVDGGDGDGAVGASPRCSAFRIGPSSYGLWGHCEHSKRWFLYPDMLPFYLALRERRLIVTKMTGAPDQDAWRRSFHIGDNLPRHGRSITSLTL
jgi:hypothetical protein